MCLCRDGNARVRIAVRSELSVSAAAIPAAAASSLSAAAASTAYEVASGSRPKGVCAARTNTCTHKMDVFVLDLRLLVMCPQRRNLLCALRQKFW
eukprot:58901-Chlamydomonas_euryale.AAC.3